MLVLTRKPGESLYIGDEIKVTLMEIKGNQVRVGVNAPPTVRIYREEIYLEILKENESAAVLSKEAPADLGAVAKEWKGRKPQIIGAMKKEKGRKEEN